ncbi:MAG: bifunctional metallophosphatase/5'-nucleotidase, partial [Coleofasciculus sp. C2-GNP5-27]
MFTRGSTVKASLAILLLSLGSVNPAQAFSLTVLHNNDGESQLINAGRSLEDFGGAARFTTLVKQLKANATTDAVITLSSGDNFLAGPEFNASLTNGVFYDATVLNEIGYDAIALGNHDFDFGPQLLADFIGSVDSSIPYLSANLDFSGELALQTLVEQERITSSTIIEKAGDKIGVIGATTPNLPFISSPGDVTVNPDVRQVVQDEIDALQSQGVNKIILISHLQGVEEDIDLIGQLQGLDIAIAGGGDELFANPDDQLIPGDEIDPNRPYPLNVTDAEGNRVPVVTTTGQYGYVGQLIVEFDEAGNLTTIDMGSGLVRVAGGNNPDAVAADPIVQDQVIEPVQAALEALENNIIATSEVPLNGERNAVRSQETNLGNLIADSLLWQANQLTSEFGIEGSIDVALQNGGGIRNNTIIPAGDITELDTFDILPFSNFVSVFPEISATQFKDILENTVSKIALDNGEPIPSGEGTGRFAQIAGFNFSYDPTQTARATDEQGNVVTPGTRVQMVTLDDG